MRSLKLYFDRIGDVPPLTVEQERQCFADIRAHADAASDAKLSAAERQSIASAAATTRDRLVRSNLRLVAKLAQRYVDSGVPMDDLVSAGNVGLIEAIDKYDIQRGTRFTTCAGWHILRCIRESVRITPYTIRVPIPTHTKVSKYRKASDNMRKANGMEPKTDDVGTAIGLSRRSVGLAARAERLMRCHHGHSGSEDSAAILRKLHDRNAARPDALTAVIAEENRATVLAMLDTLNARHRLVLTMLYGLGGAPRACLGVVSRLLGVSKQRVNQIETIALETLKRRYETCRN